MTPTTATVESPHLPRITIDLYQDAHGAWWPKAAKVGALDDIPLDYLRRNWPPAPGMYWDKDSCIHATVKVTA